MLRSALAVAFVASRVYYAAKVRLDGRPSEDLHDSSFVVPGYVKPCSAWRPLGVLFGATTFSEVRVLRRTREMGQRSGGGGWAAAN